MMALVQSKEFLRKFIAIYCKLPELWKVKSDAHKNRNAKDLAYEKLVAKLKEIDPKADRAAVHTKINALRTSYRRELKKISSSQKSGAGAEGIYKPSLWYFTEIDFLRDQEIKVEGASTINDTEVDEEINETVFLSS
ncbi:hypothetical protein J437_LFUL001699 [Ladona fulva]|uniref:MADF domain-containing protein n=1 Tax=Ladona fulva TaxID=123851 RepID=A0A8K0K2K1_LADFU|nr:hypothetical protein J437_LFUL001699 [Ladona fulva]